MKTSKLLMFAGLLFATVSCTDKVSNDETSEMSLIGNHDLAGIWKCESIAPKGGEQQPTANDVYKIIGDDYFFYFDMPKNPDSGVGVRFSVKFGTCERTSDSILVEGTENVPTYLDGNNMCLEWISGATTYQEVWKKSMPNEYVKGAIAAILPNKDSIVHEFNGVWKWETDSTSNTQMYKIINGDSYIWFSYDRESANIEFWSCSYGSFEKLASTVTIENGTLYMPIVWKEYGKSFTTFYDINQDGQNLHFQQWEKAELPETLKAATDFIIQNFSK